MTFVMFIFVALFGVAFYFINALINRFEDLKKKIENTNSEVNDLYDRLIYLRVEVETNKSNVEQDKNNIDACANAILNIRNNVGKLGNRLQAIERKGNNE